MADDNKIPEGLYCYKILGFDPVSHRMSVEVCPYWGKDHSRPEQANGFCTKLGVNDWEEGRLTMLWDQVKECDENVGSLDEVG